MTADDFRKLALSLPETTEASHMEHPDFRVRLPVWDASGKFTPQLAALTPELKENSGESMLYFKSFTDNVVLAHPRFSDDMESEFRLFQMAGKTIPATAKPTKNAESVHLSSERRRPCDPRRLRWANFTPACWHCLQMYCE